MFSGIDAVLCGILQTERASKLRDLIVSNGGKAAVHKAVAAMFIPKNPAELSPSVTHVFSGSPVMYGALCKKLNVLAIPPSVKILKDSWITDSIRKHSLQREDDYIACEQLPALSLTDATKAVDIIHERLSDAVGSSHLPQMSYEDIKDDCAEPPVKKAKTISFGTWEFLYSSGSRTNPVAMYKLNSCVGACREMIAFDMDGTLIETRSGKRFAESRSDWRFFHPSVPSVLKQLSDEGNYLAIISNQNGVREGKTSIEDIQSKLDDIVSHFDFPIDVFCAFEKDIYRKPCFGSFEFLKSARSLTSMELKFTYVGDAAGRPKNGTRSKDFAASDLHFALNCGGKFQTPEQLFLKSKLPIHCSFDRENTGFSWPEYAAAQEAACSSSSYAPPSAPSGAEIVLLVGPPASGKSTRCRKEFPLHERINQDALKTVPKCLSAARAALANGKSVIIDSTNVDPKTRRNWIQLGREFSGAKIRCIVCIPPKEVCMHLAAFRLVSKCTAPEDRREIPAVVFHTYYKNYVPPNLSEGFAEIEVRELRAEVPEDSTDRRLLNSFMFK